MTKIGHFSLSACVLIPLFGLSACDPISATRNEPDISIRAIDGDSFEIAGTILDFPNIDAPELGQMCEVGQKWEACGLQASYELEKRFALGPRVCKTVKDFKSSQDCIEFLSNIERISLETGLAVAVETASDELKAIENTAQNLPIGMWRGNFTSPKEWRAGQRGEAETDMDPCPILVVAQGAGSAYVVPTDTAYKSLQNHPKKILERLCSDEDARDMGVPHIKHSSKK